jgi:carbon storage regulator
MLILTRRPDESLKIGDQIEVSILNVKGNQVMLGIEAPSEILVLRRELLSEDELVVNE